MSSSGKANTENTHNQAKEKIFSNIRHENVGDRRGKTKSSSKNVKNFARISCGLSIERLRRV